MKAEKKLLAFTVVCAAIAGSWAARVIDSELSSLANTLWQLDVNGCNQATDCIISKQGRVTNSNDLTQDMAPNKLFTYVNENVLFKKSTYESYIPLLDNYATDTTLAEVVNTQELAENTAFINAVMNTQVMQEAHRFLVSKQKAPADTASFKQRLHDIWFGLYKRKTADRYNNSCSFEHIFVGETQSKGVLGFHNWISFYLREKAGDINYNGYYQTGTVNNPKPMVITLQFVIKGGFEKPMGGFFVGTSPEFDLAMYTTCFLIDRGSKISLRFNNTDVDVIVYGLAHSIGTAYPSEV